MEIKPIARFHSPFSSKFGIPKQAGLVTELEGQIVFEPEFRNPDALRGIEGFDYIWLIWEFSANRHKANSPVVRPPVLPLVVLFVPTISDFLLFVFLM